MFSFSDGYYNVQTANIKRSPGHRGFMRKIIDAGRYDSDKSLMSHYLRNYEECFEPFLDQDVRLLELGVYRGGSLVMWRDYFPQGLIAGLDFNPIKIEDETGRIRIYQGAQQDTALLDRIASEVAPGGFDIIIDDCAHIGAYARTSFWHLFEKHLKPGGVYAVEDWGTGYWSRWPDGKAYDPPADNPRPAELQDARNHGSSGARISGDAALQVCFPSHNYGMVGFIKELIDECGMDDITHPGWGSPPARTSKIRRMLITPGHVIVIKKGP